MTCHDCFILRLRKATGKLVEDSGLRCIACHHQVAESIEGLVQVVALDEKAFEATTIEDD